MPTLRTVEPIDVIRDIKDGCVPCGVNALPDPLFLEAAEEGLDDSIVPAVPPAARARLQVFGLAGSPPRVAAASSALIGVDDGGAAWTTSAHRLCERFKPGRTDLQALQGRATLPHPERGNVRHPCLVRM